jgi:hypothetical protein
MDPERFLDLAKLLRGGTASAEMCRTAIGRAYYAAFNVGVGALLDIGIQPNQSPSGHGELRNCLGACNDPELRRANARLGTLHSRNSEPAGSGPGARRRPGAIDPRPGVRPAVDVEPKPRRDSGNRGSPVRPPSPRPRGPRNRLSLGDRMG